MLPAGRGGAAHEVARNSPTSISLQLYLFDIFIPPPTKEEDLNYYDLLMVLLEVLDRFQCLGLEDDEN
jgi:hypothetical protein